MEVGGNGCRSELDSELGSSPPTGNGWCMGSSSGELGGGCGCSRELGGGRDSGVPGPGRLPLEHADEDEQLDDEDRLLLSFFCRPSARSAPDDST